MVNTARMSESSYAFEILRLLSKWKLLSNIKEAF